MGTCFLFGISSVTTCRTPTKPTGDLPTLCRNRQSDRIKRNKTVRNNLFADIQVHNTQVDTEIIKK
jgi:hypothetical protein